MSSEIAQNQRNTKLTSEQVEDIRRRLALGIRATRIAADFGVHASTISNIKRGQSWTASEETGNAN